MHSVDSARAMLALGRMLPALEVRCLLSIGGMPAWHCLRVGCLLGGAGVWLAAAAAAGVWMPAAPTHPTPHFTPPCLPACLPVCLPACLPAPLAPFSACLPAEQISNHDEVEDSGAEDEDEDDIGQHEDSTEDDGALCCCWPGLACMPAGSAPPAALGRSE